MYKKCIVIQFLTVRTVEYDVSGDKNVAVLIIPEWTQFSSTIRSRGI